MKPINRFPALIAYLLPVVGWIYILAFERKNPFATFHLKQSIGLFAFLVAIVGGWAVVAWLIALVPYGIILSMGLFTLVIAAMVFGLVAWLMGVSNAIRGIIAFTPLVGRRAHKLPF